MRHLPANAAGVVARISRDAMASRATPELFHVRVQQITRRLVFVARPGAFGSSALRLDKPRCASTRLMVATLRPTIWAMRRMGMRLRPADRWPLQSQHLEAIAPFVGRTAGFLCDPEAWQLQLPRPVQVNNLLKHHT